MSDLSNPPIVRTFHHDTANKIGTKLKEPWCDFCWGDIIAVSYKVVLPVAVLPALPLSVPVIWSDPTYFGLPIIDSTIVP